jgi:RNA polymerase sigma factor (sigma-70 family)
MMGESPEPGRVNVMPNAQVEDLCAGGTKPCQDGGDRQLLERFVARREEAAFAELVQRHSGMVWGVCRRVLGREEDAQDAFQGAFLVLARKAATIHKGEAVGSWLYSVALRIARVARKNHARRLELEKQARSPSALAPPWEESAYRELQVLLDEELERLPQKYRAPFVLCCLQGMTRAEAARELGWREGTVAGRVGRARTLLQRRLSRRGVAFATVLTVSALAPATAAPPALVGTTTQGTLAVLAGKAAALSPSAVGLAEAVLKGMTALKLLAGVVLLFTMSLGAVAALQQARPRTEPLPEQFYHDFRGAREPLPPLRVEGKAPEAVTRLEQAGLSLKLPAGWPHPGVWVRPHVLIGGDFELTASYELLDAEVPRGGPGVGVVLVAVSPGSKKMAKIARLLRPRDGDCYLADITDQAEHPRKISTRTVPTQARAGQLRLVRQGSTVRYLVAETPGQEFREVHRDEFGDHDVEDVAFTVSSHGSLTAVTARLLDVRIRSARFHLAPSAAAMPAPGADLPPPTAGVVLVVATGFQNDARNFEELKPPVMFSEGFFGLEQSNVASWRWMGDGLPRGQGPVPLNGLVHLLNAKKDMVLRIAAIVPLREKPTTIKFSFNGKPLDDFTLAKDRFEKTYKIPAVHLGQEEYCELLISIDSFQIPMERNKNSQDNRRLGLRVTKLNWGENEGIPPLAAMPKETPASVPSGQAEAPPRHAWPILLGIAAVIFVLVLALAVYQALQLRKAAPGAPGQDQPLESAAAHFSFPCSNCGKLLKTKTELRGKMVKCPHCGQPAQVARPNLK